MRDPRNDIASDWYKNEFNKFTHYLVKATNDVVYPVTKEEITKLVGDREISVSYTEKAKISKFIAPIKIDKFDSAAEFYNALAAVL